MKIAMITPGYLPVPAVHGGAVEILIQRLIEGNENFRKNQIDLYTIDDEQLSNVEYENTKIIRLKIGRRLKVLNRIVNYLYKIFKMKKYTTSYSRAVVREIKNKTYDYVIVQNNLMAYRDIYEKTNNRNNLIVLLHNDINIKDENHVILAKLIAKTAKKILTVSNHTKNHFLSISGCEKANVDVLYNCIDIEQYQKNIDAEDVDALKRKYGITKDDFVFMYSGRVDVYKGVIELVKAFNRLHNKQVKLLIVGKSWFGDKKINDEYLNRLKKEAEKQRSNIIFTGFVNPDDIYKIYKLADCLAIPSLWEEPFGVVALEGMASKLPLIVTKSGGLMEFVDSSCALIIEKDKKIVERLVQAMEYAVEHRQELKEVGKNGYTKVLEKREFDKNNYYQIFLKKIEG